MRGMNTFVLLSITVSTLIVLGEEDLQDAIRKICCTNSFRENSNRISPYGFFRSKSTEISEINASSNLDEMLQKIV